MSERAHVLVASVLVVFVGLACKSSGKLVSVTASDGSTAPIEAAAEPAFVLTLAQLVGMGADAGATPATMKPTKTRATADDTVLEYADFPDLPGHGLVVQKRKGNPAAWQISFQPRSDAVPYNLGSSGEVTEVKPTGTVNLNDNDDILSLIGTLYRIDGGSFSGCVIWQTFVDGGVSRLAVMSAAYAIDGGVPIRRLDWLCDHRKMISGEDRQGESTFQTQCERMVREKLLSPSSADFASTADAPIVTTKQCGRSWSAWVEASNAFGVKIKHKFRCTLTYSADPMKNGVLLDF